MVYEFRPEIRAFQREKGWWPPAQLFSYCTRRVKTRLVEWLVEGHTERWFAPKMSDGPGVPLPHILIRETLLTSQYQTGLWCSYWNHGQASPLALIHTLHPCIHFTPGTVSSGRSCTRRFAVLESFHHSGMASKMHTFCLPPWCLPPWCLPLATIQVFSIFATAVGEGLHTAPGVCYPHQRVL